MRPSGTARTEGVPRRLPHLGAGGATRHARQAGTAALLLLTLAACTSGTDAAGPSTTPAAGRPSPASTTQPSPTPSIVTPRSMSEGDVGGDGTQIPLKPGNYVIPRSVWSVEDFWVTFPEGWAVQYGHVFGANPDQEDEFGFYAVVVDEIYADPCRGERGDVVTVGPAVNDLVDALLEQPGTAKRGPVETRFGNYPAVRIDLSIQPRMQERNCFEGPGTGLQIWYSAPTDKYFVLLPDAVARVYIVDVVGERQVFVAQIGDPRSAGDRAELQAVLDSIVIEG